ncbi:MAG TPA: DEAD/DEAH box helicase [Acidiferrobacterales bacterium]|nr:DEAD/DEAH box helicase [Acidiferrobacterales bacterium]
MAFKKVPPQSDVTDSPDKLLLDLPRRKIPDVLPHQGKIMRTYANEALDMPDVALQLPTGSGKTLVGLLIAEWRRRKNRERIVYLCPTRQLVNQVVEQAEEKYGLSVHGFTGSKAAYDPAAKAEYRNADRVAVTTYTSLFNTNPFFDDADVIIVDDAHAAESYVAGLWSVRVERGNPKHAALHTALCSVVKPLLDSVNFTRLTGDWSSPADRAWVDKVPTPEFAKLVPQLVEILDAHVPNTDLRFPWSMIRGHLSACQLYLSSNEILIRPLIPPTWTHAPFQDAKQRIYMSATLGAGGDLERLLGRRHINRLPVPEGWDRHGVGRRFFIFPETSLDGEETKLLRKKLMVSAGRSLVLVPTEQLRQEVVKDINASFKCATFGADDIEESKKIFVSTTPAVAVVANRYDGIDFPGDECRLEFIEGLPKATNLQERFLMSRMCANILFNERVQTRVLQAIGRCTRSLEDYSAVVVSGGELPDYLADIRRRPYLHPELQAEIEFGLEQSKDMTIRDIVDNFEVFLKNDKEWEGVNEQIVAKRKLATQEPFPAIDELNSVVGNEVEFQERLWQGDYEAALDHAERILGGLTAPKLRGYRALWYYLAGSAAWLGAKAGATSLTSKARAKYAHAKETATDIPWLVGLARYQPEVVESTTTDVNAPLMEQIERVEATLAQLGTIHDRAFAMREKEILDGLLNEKTFEQAQKLLGELLGFDAGKVESEGSPDPWWIAGGICLVFEDHAGAQTNSALDVTKARQTSSHVEWMRANVDASKDADIIAVLVTPVTEVRKAAVPHLKDVALWSLDEFRLWARTAMATVRKLRRTFVEPGDLVWRMEAGTEFKQNRLDAEGLADFLRSQPAKDKLRATK